MIKALLVVVVLCSVVPTLVAQGSPLNRIVTKASSFPIWQAEIVFVDCDSGDATTYPAAPGHTVGEMVCMDPQGGAWFDSAYPNYGDLYHYDANGQLLAFVSAPYRPRWMGMAANGNMLLLSEEPFVFAPGNPPGLWLSEYTAGGTLLRTLDVTTLVAPGQMVPVATLTFSIVDAQVTENGYLWILVRDVCPTPLIAINSSWNLVQALPFTGCDLQGAVGDDGVWVSGGLIPSVASYPGYPSGCENFHIDLSGSITATLIGFGSVGICQGGMRRTVDGTVFGLQSSASNGRALARRPTTYGGAPTFFWPPNGIFSWRGRMVPQQANWGTVSRAFWFDGSGHVWTLEKTDQTGTGLSSLVDLTSHEQSPPHTPQKRTPVGLAVNNSVAWIGEATLYTYAAYTDPYGDLDGDGLGNQAELLTGTNPFAVSAPALDVNLVAPAPGQGGWFNLSYSAPLEAGNTYFAPFTSSADRFSFGGRELPILLDDPLIPFSMLTGQPWITGTVGIVGANGQVSVSLNLPPGIATNTVLCHSLGTVSSAGVLSLLSSPVVLSP